MTTKTNSEDGKCKSTALQRVLLNQRAKEQRHRRLFSWAILVAFIVSCILTCFAYFEKHDVGTVCTVPELFGLVYPSNFILSVLFIFTLFCSLIAIVSMAIKLLTTNKDLMRHEGGDRERT